MCIRDRGDPDTDITWTFTGDAPKATSVASLAVYAVNSTIESCTNYYNIDFAGDSGSEVLCVASGLVGVLKNSTIGGRAKDVYKRQPLNRPKLNKP